MALRTTPSRAPPHPQPTPDSAAPPSTSAAEHSAQPSTAKHSRRRPGVCPAVRLLSFPSVEAVAVVGVLTVLL